MTEVLQVQNNFAHNVIDKNVFQTYDYVLSKYVVYKLFYLHSIFNIIKNLKYVGHHNLDFLIPKKINYGEFEKNLMLCHNFLVFDKFQFIYNYCHFRECVKKYHDNFSINYAVKCLADEELIKLLIKIDGHFDCASLNEINMVIKNGGNIDNIIFANPMKPKKTIIEAHKLNVNYTTFDSVDEFFKLYEYSPNINLILRIHVDSIAKINLSNKFGMEMSDIVYLLNTKHQHLQKIKGIAFHVGSDNSKSLGYLMALKKTFEIIKLFQENNIEIKIIDLGGGFPFINYKGIIDSIFEVYGSKLKNYKLIFEPGRAICSSVVSYIPDIFQKNNKYYIDNEILYSYFKDSILADRTFYYNSLNMKDHFSIYDSNGVEINTKPMIRNFPSYIKSKNIIFENFGAYTISLAPNNINCYKIYI